MCCKQAAKEILIAGDIKETAIQATNGKDRVRIAP